MAGEIPDDASGSSTYFKDRSCLSAKARAGSVPADEEEGVGAEGIDEYSARCQGAEFEESDQDGHNDTERQPHARDAEDKADPTNLYPPYPINSTPLAPLPRTSSR